MKSFSELLSVVFGIPRVPGMRVGALEVFHENLPDYLLTRGVAGGDVEELLGGLWALMS